MSDFTTDRATRIDHLRGALLAAAADDLASATDLVTDSARERVDDLSPDVSRLRGADAASTPARAPRPAARPVRRLGFGSARGRLALAVLVLALAVPGVIIATGMVRPERAAASGLPAGTRTLTAAQPTCSAVREGIEYRCAFPEAPGVGRTVRIVNGSGQVAGGCRTLNAVETFWICYLGAAAVHHQVVAQEAL
jgi:hypothetical protein